METSTASVGKAIRNERERAGWTLQQLADAIGCSKGQLSLMETGRRSISPEAARAVEDALGLTDCRISDALGWARVPAEIRSRLENRALRSRSLLSRLKGALDSDAPLEALRGLVLEGVDNVTPLPAIPGQIPLINNVAAGDPAEFTDLDHPAGIADDYISCPDVTDPGAFAARVHGDSMTPDYREGELVVFSPASSVSDGDDCFVRLEPDSETTFKRIYFEDSGSRIRLQPLNPAHAPRVVDREHVTGLWRAVCVMRKV